MRRLALMLVAAPLVLPAFLLQASAGAQPTRFSAAAERVTMAARPTILRGVQATTLFGAVDSRGADEIVTIQAKDCGQRFFTGVKSATTGEGGTWSLEFGPGITSTLRAVWKGALSAPVTVRQQAYVALYRRSSRKFEVGVGGKWSFWHKRILFQRRVGGSWPTVKSVLLTETNAVPGYAQAWSGAHFSASVPKSSLVRAVLPLSEARPCYLAGVSDTVRT